MDFQHKFHFLFHFNDYTCFRVGKTAQNSTNILDRRSDTLSSQWQEGGQYIKSPPQTRDIVTTPTKLKLPNIDERFRDETSGTASPLSHELSKLPKF